MPKKLALTFDDGPDPEWTPQILDILKAKHVPATFFVIGANMEAHPGLVQRILAEGHEVGNHTYTHPNLADTPLAAVRLELNATQRLFEALDRPLACGCSARPIWATPSPPTPTRSCRSRKRRSWATSPSARMSTRWTGRCCRCDQMMKLVEKEVHDPNPDTARQHHPAA